MAGVEELFSSSSSSSSDCEDKRFVNKTKAIYQDFIEIQYNTETTNYECKLNSIYVI